MVCMLKVFPPGATVPSVGIPEDNLAALVRQLFSLVGRLSQRESLSFQHASGLTMPQIIVLHVLRRAEDTISGLAARLRMSLPATSQLVDRLVEAGLVQRTEHESDRRVRRVTIRPAGLRFLERLGNLRREEIDFALRSLAPLTRARFASALSEVLGELNRELESQSSERRQEPPRRRP